MTFDQNHTLREFLDAAAAKQPAPGGGSVAALAGALAASMGEMVLNYSIGKKNLAQHEPDLRVALAEFTHARSMLLQLMVEDQLAFEALTAARKLPEGSPERLKEYPVALMAAITAPQAMGAIALAILELCQRVVDKVNPFLLSDLAVCADLAMSTFRCAGYNVRVNLSSLSEADRGRILAESATARSRATGLIQSVSHRIWTRVEGQA